MKVSARPAGARLGVHAPGLYVLLTVCALALIALQTASPVPHSNLLVEDLLNAGHAPLYGTVALAVLVMFRIGRPRWRRATTYLLSFTIAVAAGVGAEIVQWAGSGDAGVADVVTDAVGAASFLLIAAAYDRGGRDVRARSRRTLPLLAAAALLSMVAIAPVRTAAALVRRDSVFPRICDFQHAWERKFVQASREALLRFETPPEGWGRAAGDLAGRIDFQEGTYPGIGIRSLHRDWRGYRSFALDVFSELDHPVALTLSIHDAKHHALPDATPTGASGQSDYYDRFNRELTIVPGANAIVIPVADIEHGSRGRMLNLSRMCGLVLFAYESKESFTLHVDAFRLE